MQVTKPPTTVILLLQADESNASRIWAEYGSIDEALEQLVLMMEEPIRREKPNQQIESLEEYLIQFDKINEVVLLRSNDQGYFEPIHRQKIKTLLRKLYQRLVGK